MPRVPYLSRDSKLGREIATRSWAADRDGFTVGARSFPRRSWRTAHATPPAPSCTSSHLEPLPGRAGCPDHRRRFAPRPTHRPAVASTFPVRGPRPPGHFLRPLRDGDTQARRDPRASRARSPPRTPDLGGGVDPRDAPSPGARRTASGHPDSSAVALAGRPRPRPAGTAALERAPAGQPAS